MLVSSSTPDKVPARKKRLLLLALPVALIALLLFSIHSLLDPADLLPGDEITLVKITWANVDNELAHLTQTYTLSPGTPGYEGLTALLSDHYCMASGVTLLGPAATNGVTTHYNVLYPTETGTASLLILDNGVVANDSYYYRLLSFGTSGLFADIEACLTESACT